MLSINVKVSSVKTLNESYLQAAKTWVGYCSVCQRRYQLYGSYGRKMPKTFGPTAIQRVYCVNCKKSHALLPCFIIPYSRVLAEVKEAAVAGLCFSKHTIEELAELLGIEPTTLARWWRVFKNKSNTLLKTLVNMLADTYAPSSDWLCGDFTTMRGRGRKILQLIGRCRATYSPCFELCNFAWINLLDPYLLI